MNYLGAPQIAFDHTERGGGGDINVKDLMSAFEKRDEKLIAELATVQVKTAAVAEQLAQIEQRIAEGDGGSFQSRDTGATVGEQFINSENVKGLLETANRRGKADLQLKASLTSLTTDAAGSVGAGMARSRDNMVLLPQRRLTVRSLLPQIQITTGAVEVPVQKDRNNNAAMVAEGTAKPQSDIQLELKTFNARTIAHWMKASRQVLDDVPQLRGIVDNELLQGLGLKEEGQLLNGDGTGQNLFGMVPQATAYSAPIAIASATSIDTIGLALLQNALAEYPADGIIMNPADWLYIRLLKDAGGNYIFGEPGQTVEPRLFGVPVIATPAMAVDKFLVGQFQTAATIYDRWDARVEIATENEDDFIKNMLTILAEQRLAFAVKRPLALTYGDFGRVA
ncbi:phage major capsid protein [Devosia neptuniae]|uniref:phage major capsid protein n=1 Tax=Devosia neptuniae TaxID=191302 RepID=UPI0022AFF4AD|nr:phage major capsid protein [Devosia neptuniae]MCZ4344493.1 phage major capsid protein [Devosia neptuniae]